jgi:ubiquinone/menaquinone biosynthesis C-methylase UbiE
VLATDVSREALDVAARFAEEEGIGNITTRVMNAEHLDLPSNEFDAVISRFGLMLISRREQALGEIRRVLASGRRMAALVWSRPERNPLFTADITVLGRYVPAGVAETLSDPFSLSDVAAFARVLGDADFREVEVQTIPLTFRFPTFDALRSWWGRDFNRALATLEPELGQRLNEEAWQEVRRFEGPEGIVGPAEVLLAVGTK